MSWRKHDGKKLVSLYKELGTVSAVARHLGIKNHCSIRRGLRESGITIERVGNKGHKKYDLGKVIKLYNSGLNSRQVAKEIGTHYQVIRKYLREAGIKCRKGNPGFKLSPESEKKKVETFKKTYDLRNYPSYWSTELLEICPVCGDMFRHTSKNDRYRTCRKGECSSKWRTMTWSGENHPNWQGGISKEEYGDLWDEKLREYIRVRDNRECQVCGAGRVADRALSVHHIDFNKLNCNTDNLIALCSKCHMKVHVLKTKDKEKIICLSA